ncbi:MAG: hypothetical protein KDA60_08595, partial [Planctomycetales bacterium]|nr:hypothetical protein [Planctomycetales bacterium]
MMRRVLRTGDHVPWGPPVPRFQRRFAGWIMCCVGMLVALMGAAQPEGEDQAEPSDAAVASTIDSHAQPRAYLVRVPLPISESVDTTVERSISRIVDDWKDATAQPIVILEFWPAAEQTDAQNSQFERSLSLARFLLSERMGRIRTVAYVPRSVTGHGILPVLACEEIIMHPDAELGAAGIVESTIDPIMRRGYTEIAERRRTVPSALVLGMLDPSLTVYKAETAAGVRYLLADELAQLEQETVIRSRDTVIGPGDMAKFTGSEARLTYGFASHLASERHELADVLDLQVSDLELDPSMGDEWHGLRVDLTSPISEAQVSQIIRGIDERLVAGDVNFLCVYIDCPGGDPAASVRLANHLAHLDGSRIRSVSFIGGVAHADATLIAMATDHLVIEKDGILGGSGAHQPTESEIDGMRSAIQVIAREKSRRWSLPAALIDPQLEVAEYAVPNSTRKEYFCAEELGEQRQPEVYQRQGVVSAGGELLRLEGSEAEEVGLARFTVSGFNEFSQLYQLNNALEPVEPNWAHHLVDTLASPQVAGTLLFFGGMALMFELSAPGIGGGGFVAALFFAVFFWSQFLNNTATWLEVVLFVTGLACIAFEIFVLPGFGIFGFGGGALVIVSLILASQTFIIPRNEYQLNKFPQSMAMVAASMGGIIAGMVILRRYFDRAPVLNR